MRILIIYIKGEMEMKKILSAIIAASVVFCASAGVFAAPTYSNRGRLTVESDINMKNNSKSVTVRGSARLDITALFIWRTVDGTRATEKKFLVTSEAGRVEEGTEHPFIPTEVSLRISNDNAKVKKKYIVGETSPADSDENDGKVSVFEYYTLTVSDDDGVVFEADGIPSDTTELEIPLGLFNYDGESGTNSKNYSDERNYIVSLKENKNLNKGDVTEYALPTKWNWYVDAEQQAYRVNGEPTPTPKATPAPAAEVTASPAAEPEISAAPAAEPEASPLVRATATPRVRATATPKATTTPAASAKSASSAKASATATPKANPKTGNSAPIAGLSMLGILALAAIAVIQVKKKSN